MSSTLGLFLRDLEREGFTLKKNSVERSWMKKLYAFVSYYIVTNVQGAGEETTKKITRKLIQQLHCQGGGKCFPVRKELITINKLKTSSHVIFGDITKNEYESPAVKVEHESLSMDFEGRFSVESEQYMLIGCLSNVGSIKKHLYLHDNTARILCHMITLDPSYLNTVVFIPNWRFVPPVSDDRMPFTGYIEVLSEPLILFRIDDVPKETPSPRTRQTLDLKGIIASISSCLRLRSWSYIVNIFPHCDDGTTKQVLISGESQAFWISCMHTGCEVTLMGLKRSKMKIEERNFEILTTTASSSLTIHRRALSEDGLHSQQKLMNALGEVRDTDHRIDVDGTCPLYIGKILSVICHKLAIYMLDDGRVALHCTYIPCEDLGCAIRPGATVLITNVHAFMKDNSVHLICCSASNVRVVSHSTRDEIWQPICVLGNRLVNQFLMHEQHHEHPIQSASIPALIDQLCANYPFLTKELLTPTSKDDPKSRDSILPRILSRSEIQDFQQKKPTRSAKGTYRRDPFSETLSTPHECVVERLLKRPSNPFHLVSIKELVTLAKKKADEDFQRQSFPDYWRHLVLDGTELLSTSQDTKPCAKSFLFLGCIKGNKTTGQLQIADNTGAIECVILRDPKDDATPHTLCTRDTNAFVKFEHFSVVVETTLELQAPKLVECSEDLPSTSEIFKPDPPPSPLHRCCIICYHSDVLVLKKTRVILRNCCRRLGCCCHDDEPKKGDGNEVKVEKKEDPGPSLHQIDSKPSVLEADIQAKCILLITNIHPVKRSPSGSSLVVNGLRLKDRDVKQNGHCSEVTINFTGSLVKWRPFLQLGMILQVTSYEYEEFDSSAVLHITEGSELRHLHDDDPSLLSLQHAIESMKRQWKTSYYWKSLMNVFTVSEIFLKPPPPRQLVSVRGRIHSRTDYVSQGYLSRRIEITDAAQRHKLCMYMGKVSEIPPMNGIIPGATVVFQKIKVCVSGRGQVYLKFGAISNTVVEACERTAINKSVSMTPDKLENLQPDDISSKKAIVKLERTDVDSSNCHRMECDGMDSDAERLKDHRSVEEIDCSFLFNIYNHQQEKSSPERDELLKLRLFVTRVLQVRISKYEESFKPEKKHAVRGPSSAEFLFYAKCLTDDHTGRAYVHFNTSTFNCFFRLLNISLEHREELVEIWRKSKHSRFEYDCDLHDGKNIVMDFSALANLREDGSLGLCSLILLCNKVNASIMPSRHVMVRRKVQLRKQNDSEEVVCGITDDFTPHFTAGTIAVGSQEQDQMLSLNLKPLHFHCVEVL